MPSIQVFSSTATCPGGDWLSPGNAAAGDSSAYSRLPGAAGASPLLVAFPPLQLPPGAVLTGLYVEILACQKPFDGANAQAFDLIPDGRVRTLSAYLSRDGGSTQTGAPRRTGDLANSSSFLPRALGGASDLWGGGVLPADLAGGNLRLCVQRANGQGDEDPGGDRSVESARLTAFYAVPAGTTMPDRIAEAQRAVLGAEATRGTAVPATMLLKTLMLQPQPQNEGKDLEYQGDIVAGDYVLTSEASETSLDGYLTFDEIGLALASSIGKPVTTALGGGAYRHLFWLNVKGAADAQTYTLDFGDDLKAERITNLILAEMGIDTSRKDHSVKGKLLGRNVQEEGVAMTPGGINDVQTVTLSAGVTGGSFRLAYNGAETGDLSFNVNAAALQTALAALGTVGAGNLAVTGTGPFTVTGAGAFAGRTLALLDVTRNALVGGSTPGVAVAKTVPGGYRTFSAVPVLPGMWGLYYSADRASLGTPASRVRKLYGSSLSVANRYDPVWEQDPTQPSWASTIENRTAVTFKATVQADPVSLAMAADLRNRTPRYLRLEAVGGPIGASASNYRLRIDAAVKIKAIQNFKEDQKVYAREFEMGARFDPIWGQALCLSLDNDVPGYPI